MNNCLLSLKLAFTYDHCYYWDIINCNNQDLGKSVRTDACYQYCTIGNVVNSFLEVLHRSYFRQGPSITLELSSNSTNCNGNVWISPQGKLKTHEVNFKETTTHFYCCPLKKKKEKYKLCYQIFVYMNSIYLQGSSDKLTMSFY